MTSDVQNRQTATRGPTDAVREALGRVLLSAARAWAGVPSGPLGWVSTRTVFPLTSGTLYRTMAEALDLQPDDEVLDVGCGSGAFLAQHAGRVRRVAGIDLSDIQIDLAQRHLADRIAAGTADIVHGDASVLPWPDESFTAVTCMAVFEVFPDPAQVLAEVFRVLRPGGRAVMTIGERVPADTQTERRWGRCGCGQRTTWCAWWSRPASRTSPCATHRPGAATRCRKAWSGSGTGSASTCVTYDW